MNRIKNYFYHKRHAWCHLLHGLFPWIGIFEKRVNTPDYDHRGNTGSRRKDYWDHLVMNLKCRKIHIYMGRHKWIKEVEVH